MNQNRVKGIGLAVALHLRGESHDSIVRMVREASEGFVFANSAIDFVSGAREALALMDELNTLRRAAIEHAKEAEKEAEKAEAVVESATDDKQLALPIATSESSENASESESESAEKSEGY